MEPLLKVSGLTKTFSRQGQADFTAVKNISFDLFPGECLAIIGESGSGKSLTCMAQLGLAPPSLRVSGSVSGVAEPVSERVERLFRHETVGAALHRIVLIVGKMVYIPVESYGKFPVRIVISEENVGYGCSAFLSRVPCLYDGIASLGFRNQSHGATRIVDKYDFLAHFVQTFQYVALYFG